MNYEEFYLEEHEITVEVGVLPNDEVGHFLSKFEIKNNLVSKDHYESYVLKHLVKKYSEIGRAHV
jgi:hypothetical protein